MDINTISFDINNELVPIVNQSDKIASVISIVSIILGIISIFLIVKALDKKKDIKSLVIWIAMYIVSIITRAIPEIMFSYGMMVGYEPTFWAIYGKLILNIITLIIRIAMIVYPIYIIRKNKKENK